MEAAVAHCTRGAGIWEWASNDDGELPDVVMACAGDVPTLETLAAVDLLRQHLPELKVRVVNVVDLMRLQPESEHPHGMSDREFDTLFTADRPVIFAYHGYPRLIHRLTYRRTNHDNLHVRGFKEEGTTTTPFDMVMLNDLDRFRLVIDVIDRVPGLAAGRPGCGSGWPTRGSTPGPTPASTARTTRRSAAGPGRTTRPATGSAPAPVATTPATTTSRRWRGRDGGVRMRVLVVNTGSSSVKLRLLSGHDAARLDRPAGTVHSGAGGGRRARSAGWPASPVWTVSGTASCTAARRSPSRSWSTTRSGSSCSRWWTWRRCTCRRRWPGWTRSGRRCRRCRRWPASTPRSTRRMPAAATTYALPRGVAGALGARRYGFHGLSHAYAARRAPEILERPGDGLRLVSCHLGAGASLCAVHGGTLGRHHDGLHAAGGAGDGDPVRLGRPGAGALAAAPARARRRRRSPTGWSTARGCSGWPAPRTCARC